jgi:hypothetical protein
MHWLPLQISQLFALQMLHSTELPQALVNVPQ